MLEPAGELMPGSAGMGRVCWTAGKGPGGAIHAETEPVGWSGAGATVTGTVRSSAIAPDGLAEPYPKRGTRTKSTLLFRS